jgi:hypothetical protein
MQPYNDQSSHKVTFLVDKQDAQEVIHALPHKLQKRGVKINFSLLLILMKHSPVEPCFEFSASFF